MLALLPLAFMLVVGLAGCGGGGGVAATVNGENIMEDDVSAYIAQIRISYDLEDDTRWADYLVANELTPEEVRSNVVNLLAQEKIIAAAAAEAGIEIPETEIDTAIESVKSQYASDEEFTQSLKAQDMTEEKLRDTYKQYSLIQQVRNQLVPDPEPTEEQIQAAIDQEAPKYDGAKRSSHILFSLDDKEKAQDVLYQVRWSSAERFAEAAKQYSTDSSAENGGDVGWDKLRTYVEEYQTALDNLSLNQVTPELVESEFGYHIIRCTDVFNYTEGMTRDDIPQEILDKILSSLKSSLESQAYTDYVTQLVENSEIVINDMPGGLPYDVDISSAVSSTDDASVDNTAATAADAPASNAGETKTATQ